MNLYTLLIASRSDFMEDGDEEDEVEEEGEGEEGEED